MKARFFTFMFAVSFSCGLPAERQDPIWYKRLPACPCRSPDEFGIKLKDDWARDKGDIAHFHRGASQCYRSYPAVKTTAGRYSQPCCYDTNNTLITSGSGAGTPDKVSTCSGEDKAGSMTLRTVGILGHYLKDVRPWEKAGNAENAWQKYNQKWVPNKGDNCP